ncbi:MAG: alpha-amylase family glycosyl hydrolase [Caldilineales bacterium]|nr:alpha-amylase family glycosyl hydrolase [Caldilineales bacterium]MDW8316245.1 alpha-amylase family glycosyl hydrolase [Anaerolineae bacterium]
MTTSLTPQWVKDAIFYQIFPDRFARSASVPKPSNLEPWDSPPTVHGFKGGDLMGVVERLDYLQDLGVTAIYFNPVFASTANHRYHTYDYFQVDPILGGNAALRRLLDEAHRRGIRVILDGVFNHASRGFFQFNHLLENGPASPYLDWFIVHGWPLHAYDGHRPPNYASWWNLHALPKLNTRTPAVREFLWNVGSYWVEQGIDGWRLDVPNEINDDEFWREFRRRVKAANPEAYIVGEIWDDASRWLQGDQFDAVMNYPVTRACLGLFAHRTLQQDLLRNTGYGYVPLLDVASFAEVVDENLHRYPRDVVYAQLNLLDSHDTPRFLTLARGDESAFRLASLFLMTYPGAPCIYYGDEIGMTGGRDPDCRRAFPWPDGNSPAVERWNMALLDHVRRAIALRKAHPALRRGDFIRLHAAEEVYAYARRLGDEVLVVVLNTGLRTAHLALPVADLLPEGAALQAVWGEGGAQVADGRLPVSLPPRSGLVLARA